MEVVLEFFLADEQIHLAGLHGQQAAGGGGDLAKQKDEAHEGGPAAKPGQPLQPSGQSHLTLNI